MVGVGVQERFDEQKVLNESNEMNIEDIVCSVTQIIVNTNMKYWVYDVKELLCSELSHIGRELLVVFKTFEIHLSKSNKIATLSYV